MEIIVEDGTNIAEANSYVSIEYARQYANSRGKGDKFADDEKVSEALIRAMDFLNSIDNFKGLPSYEDQTLLWPRTGAIVNRIKMPENVVPQALKYAQVELAIAVLDGVELFPNYGKAVDTAAQVKRKKVGPIEKEFFQPSMPAFEELSLPYVDTLLDSLRVHFPVLRTIRV